MLREHYRSLLAELRLREPGLTRRHCRRVMRTLLLDAPCRGAS